jgi:hypothetical protein
MRTDGFHPAPYAGRRNSRAPEVQKSVFSATALFERCVWLLRRYVLLLDGSKRQAAANG